MAYLKYVGTGVGYLDVGTIFDMSRNVAHRSVQRVIHALLHVYGNEVRWPTRAESNLDEAQFYAHFGVRGARGAMDGTDIRVRTPSSETSVAYFNKDGFHSIKLHIVCGFRFAFLNVILCF